MLAALGHHIVEPVPSLFTFNIPGSLNQLSGISIPEATVSIAGSEFECSGPMLITHWGISGPAVLRLSSIAARHLASINYVFVVRVNWCSTQVEETLAIIQNWRISNSRKTVDSQPLLSFPNRLWQWMLAHAGISATKNWADVSNREMKSLASTICDTELQATGKSTFKEEFVTAGGVALREVDFKTMQSKLHNGLYMAGEVLDIDAVTGGFNFQAAWTCSWIAARHIAGREN